MSNIDVNQNNQPPTEDQNHENNQKKLKRSKTKYTPSNVPFRVAYQCYFILLGITLFSLSLSSYILYESAMDYYELIISNWHKQPISSIRMTSSTCASNEEPLIEYHWPGTVDGCDCRYRRRMLYERRNLFVRHNEIYNNHACNITQLAYGCTSVYSMDPITFDKFPDITGQAGFQLCAIREINNDFYSNVPNSDNCPNGQIKCGTEENYFYCTAKQECPIRKVGIKGKTVLENQEEGNSITSQTLIYTRKMAKSLPIVEFRVSEAGVCFKNSERGMSSGRIDYTLMRENKTDCATDPRFEPILIDNEVNYYKANGQSNLNTKLRGYSINSDYLWGIYQRPFIMWNMSCRGKDMDDFKDQQVYLNDILDSQTSLLIISIIFLIVISIILTVISCANIQGYDWPCISGKGTEESNYIFYLEIFLKTAIQLPHAIIIIVSFARVNQEIDYLDGIIKKNCSDEYVSSQLTNLKDTLSQNVYGFNLGQLIVFFITTAADFAIASFLCQSYYRERQNKFRQSMNQANTFEMQQNPQLQQYNTVPQNQLDMNPQYPNVIDQPPIYQNNPINPDQAQYPTQYQQQPQNPYNQQQQNPYYQQPQYQQQNPFSS